MRILIDLFWMSIGALMVLGAFLLIDFVIGSGGDDGWIDNGKRAKDRKEK